MIKLKPFEQEDWSILLKLANQAVSFAPQENEEWLEYRKAFDESARIRRHYLADDDNTPIGYGSLEQQHDDLDLFRVYVVTRPDRLRNGVGDMLFRQLRDDARELKAVTLWVREFEDDKPTCKFFADQGFVQTQRVTLPDYPPMVIMELKL